MLTITFILHGGLASPLHYAATPTQHPNVLREKRNGEPRKWSTRIRGRADNVLPLKIDLQAMILENAEQYVMAV